MASIARRQRKDGTTAWRVQFRETPGVPTALVFQNRAGTAITHSNFHQRKWVRACETAGVVEPRPRIHDLRHYFASEMLAAGVPIHVVSQRLGHEDITTTVRVYAFITPEAQQAGLDEMSQLLDG